MSRAESPLIAVNGELVPGDDPGLSLKNRYPGAVLKAGGVPVAIPPVGAPKDLERLLDSVDGVLLTGGDDFDTERLGRGPIHPAAKPVPTWKQDFDLLLARRALERGIPVLGICYGMQLLGLLAGAELLQHLPHDRPDGLDHGGSARHVVRIAQGSKLAGIMDVEEVATVSRHHQALDGVTAPWIVSATSDDGLVEAIERPDHPFAVGVQWHPELAEEGSPHDRLFRGLVGAAALSVLNGEMQRT